MAIGEGCIESVLSFHCYMDSGITFQSASNVAVPDESSYKPLPQGNCLIKVKF